VAAGIVPLAIGTDTGGSIRVPAAFCGLFGYRGVPGSPLIDDAFPLSPSFDTAGWFTRTAADMLTATEALAGLTKMEREPRGCYLDMPGLDADVALACRNASAVLAPAADSATRDELLRVFAPAAEVYGVLAGIEAWKIHKKWADRHRERYGPLLRDRLDRSRAISPAQVAAVESSNTALLAAWKTFFRSHDFLVMAAAPFPALENSNLTAANRLSSLGLTAPASLGGLPALTIPVPLPSGLTAGLQVVFNDPQSPAIPWVLGTFA
jgi:amidase/aspartyl-tRNA(Asn)/glutamyl-tRNA(Gln) amidotransferase subunit A